MDDTLNLEDDAKFAALAAWIQQHGGRAVPSRIHGEAGLRGLYTEAALQAGDELVLIPTKLLLTPGQVRKLRIGGLIAAQVPEVSDFGWLAAGLLETRRDGGFWAPYVELMPQRFDSHPVGCWTDFPPSSPLSLTTLHTQAVRKAALKEWTLLAPVLQAQEGWTADDFSWAYCCVRSRAFQLAGEDRTVSLMVPLFDQANHGNSPDIESSLESPGYVSTVQRALAAGSAVINSYGELSNAKLLALYGFCLDSNPYNEAMISGEDAAFIATAHYAHGRTRQMFAALRRSRLGADAAEAADAPDGLQALSVDNELAVLEWLALSSQASLQQWAYGEGEFVAALDEGGEALHPLWRNILVSDLGEIRVLAHYIRLAAAASAWLREPAAEVSEALRQAIGDDDYLQDLQRLRQGAASA